jgi:hypothetical protein
MGRESQVGKLVVVHGEKSSPALRQLWNELQDLAVEAIKISALELSGIRDGDGAWEGADVPSYIFLDLESVCSRLKVAYAAIWRASGGVGSDELLWNLDADQKASIKAYMAKFAEEQTARLKDQSSSDELAV